MSGACREDSVPSCGFCLVEVGARCSRAGTPPPAATPDRGPVPAPQPRQRQPGQRRNRCRRRRGRGRRLQVRSLPRPTVPADSPLISWLAVADTGVEVVRTRRRIGALSTASCRFRDHPPRPVHPASSTARAGELLDAAQEPGRLRLSRTTGRHACTSYRGRRVGGGLEPGSGRMRVRSPVILRTSKGPGGPLTPPLVDASDGAPPKASQGDRWRHCHRLSEHHGQELSQAGRRHHVRHGSPVQSCLSVPARSPIDSWVLPDHRLLRCVSSALRRSRYLFSWATVRLQLKLLVPPTAIRHFVGRHRDCRASGNVGGRSYAGTVGCPTTGGA